MFKLINNSVCDRGRSSCRLDGRRRQTEMRNVHMVTRTRPLQNPRAIGDDLPKYNSPLYTFFATRFFVRISPLFRLACLLPPYLSTSYTLRRTVWHFETHFLSLLQGVENVDSIMAKNSPCPLRLDLSFMIFQLFVEDIVDNIVDNCMLFVKYAWNSSFRVTPYTMADERIGSESEWGVCTQEQKFLSA